MIEEAAQRLAAARAEVEAVSREPAPPGSCQICGRPIGCASVRGAHINCTVTPEFRAWLREAWWSTPSVTLRQIAAGLGVSIHVAKAWTGSRR